MQIVPKLFFLSLLIAMSACSKEEDQPVAPKPEPKADYMKLKPGNYWIYNEYKVNPAGETDEHVQDSVYVEKDTMINGMVYHKLVKPNHWETAVTSHYLRDSLDYIVDRHGSIRFSESDFTSIFRTSYMIHNQDTIAKVTTQMTDKNKEVNTPAGTFLTSAYLRSYAMTPFADPMQRVVRYHTRYAKDVGMVTEVLAIYSHNPDERWERRLVRWHVE